MRVMILESGAKAKTVKKYLGKGWMVEACNGHVQDLPFVSYTHLTLPTTPYV